MPAELMQVHRAHDPETGTAPLRHAARCHNDLETENNQSSETH